MGVEETPKTSLTDAASNEICFDRNNDTDSCSILLMKRLNDLSSPENGPSVIH